MAGWTQLGGMGSHGKTRGCGRSAGGGKNKNVWLLVALAAGLGLLGGWRVALNFHARTAAQLAEAAREREELVREALTDSCARTDAYAAGWRAANAAPRKQEKNTPHEWSLRSFMA